MSTAEQRTQSDLVSHPSFMFAMGELSGQVKALTDEISQFREDRSQELQDIKIERGKDRDRIATLEMWRYWTIGAAAAITFVINIVILLWRNWPHG